MEYQGDEVGKPLDFFAPVLSKDRLHPLRRVGLISQISKKNKTIKTGLGAARSVTFSGPHYITRALSDESATEFLEMIVVVQAGLVFRM